MSQVAHVGRCSSCQLTCQEMRRHNFALKGFLTCLIKVAFRFELAVLHSTNCVVTNVYLGEINICIPTIIYTPARDPSTWSRGVPRQKASPSLFSSIVPWQRRRIHQTPRVPHPRPHVSETLSNTTEWHRLSPRCPRCPPALDDDNATTWAYSCEENIACVTVHSLPA